MTITCPKCSKTFEKTLFPLGPRVGCPKCGTHFDIAQRDTVPYGGDPELPELPQAGEPSPNAPTKPAPVAADAPVAHSDAAPAPAPARPVQAGDQLGQYVLEKEIGRGGMGTVWLATQKSLNRKVAVKLLDPRLSRDPHFVARFEREARSLASLHHPRIVAILDRGNAQGYYYFVMEYVEGPSLRELMSSGAIAPTEALRLVPQICEALEYAHSRGVIHRDIKPANILRDPDGNIKIADFGLSRIVGNEQLEPQITATNMVMGTMDYMAPEQREQSKGVDHRADIYSLGVVFYELLTGELPLGRFEPPSRRNGEVDGKFDRVVLKVLEKNPELRYQRASHVSDDIRQVQESRGLGDDAAAQARAAVQVVADRGRQAAHQAQPWLEENWGGWVLAGVMVFFFFTLCSGQWYLAFPAIIGWGVMNSHMKRKALARAGIVPMPGEDTDVLFDRHQAGLPARDGEPVAAMQPQPVPEPPAPTPRFSFLALFAFLLSSAVALPSLLIFAFGEEMLTEFAGFGPDARTMGLTLALPTVGLPLLLIFAIAAAARSRFNGRPELRGRGLAGLAVLFSLSALGSTGYAWVEGLQHHRLWTTVERKAIDPADAPRLLEETGDDPITRQVILRQIDKMPTETAWRLLGGAVETADSELKVHAARWLGRHQARLADAAAGWTAIDRLLQDDDEWVRRTAVEALGKIGGAESAGRLRAVLEGDAVLRHPALHAMRGCGEHGTRALAALLTGETTARHREDLLEHLSPTELSESAKDLIPSLTRYLGDESRGVRGEAVKLLTRTGRVAADAVAMQLVSEDPRARCNAALVLGDIGTDRHLKLLQQLRTDDDNERVQQFARNAAKRLGDRLR
ncbi:MAG: protein kinase domain-containing protein [Planctomycetota bacterium]